MGIYSFRPSLWLIYSYPPFMITSITNYFFHLILRPYILILSYVYLKVKYLLLILIYIINSTKSKNLNDFSGHQHFTDPIYNPLLACVFTIPVAVIIFANSFFISVKRNLIYTFWKFIAMVNYW